MRTRLFAALALAAVMTAPASARRERAGSDPICDPVIQASRAATSPAGLMIAGFDANADARVDRAELKAGTERMFAIADANRDGTVSLIELAQWASIWLGAPSGVPGRFDFDRDQDDRISPTEFAAELQRRFNGFDADKDGVVTRAELLASAVPKECVNGRLMPPKAGGR